MAVWHHYFWSKWSISIEAMNPLHSGGDNGWKGITDPYWITQRSHYDFKETQPRVGVAIFPAHQVRSMLSCKTQRRRGKGTGGKRTAGKRKQNHGKSHKIPCSTHMQHTSLRMSLLVNRIKESIIISKASFTYLMASHDTACYHM